MNKFDKYYKNGIVALPKSVQYYVCIGDYEYDKMPIEEKLLDLAFFFAHGGDLLKEIKDMLNLYPDRDADIVKLRLLDYIEYLRSGQEIHYILPMEEMAMESIVCLLKEELLVRYVYNDRGQNHHLKQVHIDIDKCIKGKTREECIHMVEHPMTDGIYMTWDELLEMNPWWHFIGGPLPKTIRRDGQQMVYSGDKSVVTKYNEKNAGKSRLILDIPPEPFRGNVLDPKIVVLSLNPGYVDRLNGQLVTCLNQKSIDEFVDALSDNLDMKKSKIVFNEVDNIIGDGYWMRMFSEVMHEINDTSGTTLLKAAVIQYIPYFSERLNNWNDRQRLSSQNFTRHLVRHLLYVNTDCLFLIMRAEKHWRSLIGEEMDRFKDRFIFGKNPQVQNISAGNLGTKNFRRVVDHLK